MKNVILADYDVADDWEFKKTLEEETKELWQVASLTANTNHKGARNILRYIIYFWLPLKYAIKIKEYKNIVAWQQFFGLILAGYLRLLHVSGQVADIYVMELIYKPKKGMIGKLYKSFVQFTITSKYIKKIFVFTEKEKKLYADTFHVPEDKFEILQLGIDDCWDEYCDEIRDDGYYVAAGRSNRDYEFLVNVWKEDYKLKIICDNYKNSIKSGIEVLSNCYKRNYMEELAHCHAVIVPLADEHISSGQLVVLQAKMLGKPVIVSKNEAIEDYFVNGEDGYIIEKKADQIWKSITLLEDTVEYNRISTCARNNFKKGFSVTAMGRKVGLCFGKSSA